MINFFFHCATMHITTVGFGLFTYSVDAAFALSSRVGFANLGGNLYPDNDIL